MKDSNIYRPRHLVSKNIYQISKFNSCSTVTTLQDLATISEVCTGFNIIVTGLVSCLINTSERMQNASLRRKFRKNLGSGRSPPQTLSVEERVPLPKPHRRLRRLDTRTFGARPRLDKFCKSNPDVRAYQRSLCYLDSHYSLLGSCDLQ